jgi:hypothetical protein
MFRRHRVPLMALAAIALAACGSGGAASPPPPQSTVGNVGHLPGPLADGTSPSSTVASDIVPVVTAADDEPSSAVRIGELAEGNDLLVLGDSILEATSSRYGDTMCEELVPRGWEVEVDAENGREAGGGLAVLEDRLESGDEWDAAVVMLGNNYRHDPRQFDEQLEEILDLLSPAPVLLLTVTEFEADRAEVNYVIRTEAAERVNVDVLEWADRTRHDDSLVGDDGLHLSQRGRAAIASMVGLALGDAPDYSVGDCIDN